MTGRAASIKRTRQEMEKPLNKASASARAGARGFPGFKNKRYRKQANCARKSCTTSESCCNRLVHPFGIEVLLLGSRLRPLAYVDFDGFFRLVTHHQDRSGLA